MIDTKKIFEFDKSLLNDQIKTIGGIDEVGRGPLAGPVVTAMVIMPYDQMIDGVFDSKALTKHKREELYKQILDRAISVSIAQKSERVIDEINILNATKQAMAESYNNSVIKPDLLLIDAVKLNVSKNERAIIKGDATSYAIACASIVAKVYRDRLMEDYAKTYTDYGFEQNAGYGTKQHLTAIVTKGICPLHRLSFLKNLLGEDECTRLKDLRDKGA